MAGYLYLASPYSVREDAPEQAADMLREERYLAACRAAGALMCAGHRVFSPIAHSHPVERHGIGGRMSGAFWKEQDIPLLRHSSHLVVLMLPGWETSEGIAWEVETAEALHIPVTYLEPDGLHLFRHQR